MQRIPVAQLKPGMILAKNVYNDDGQKLLAAETAITGVFIRRLIEMQIPAVYITNPYMEGIEVVPVVSEDLRILAAQTMRRVFSILGSPRPDIPYPEIQALGKSIVTEVLRNKDAVLHLTDIKTADSYTFDHSVNVCIVAILIAANMNYTEDRLCDLALGALMHDTGKILIDAAILNKPDRLTEEEMTIMKRHSELGFERLRGSGTGISVPAMHVAYQHHERFDGNGYPRGLKSYEIHEYARIVAIADVYDALISDRPYRSAKLPHEAYEIILASNQNHFDPDILQHFLAKVAIYPVGTVVQLTNGDTGIVIAVQPGITSRPLVRLVLNKRGKLYVQPIDIDLREQLTVFVEKVIRDRTIFELTRKKPGET